MQIEIMVRPQHPPYLTWCERTPPTALLSKQHLLRPAGIAVADRILKNATASC